MRSKNKSSTGIERSAVYSDITGRDELFVKHFVYLLKVDVPNASPSIEKQAIEYSRIYQEQIKKGKTALFANKYADLLAAKISPKRWCYAEAAEYEKEIKAGSSEDYASTVATIITNYIANNCSTYEEAMHDKLVDMERKELEKIYAHLK